ncbi:MAG: FtsQ-type POTRA domain-containing protein [Propionibacteriaceae bacterium]|jgi:cell division protein FtsQ|nr:FtsQ-type POTRA domain-containing protein [Propionibacteriaceae bacterium]
MTATPAVRDVTAELRRSRRRRQRRRRRLAVSVAAVVLLLGGAVWLVGFSPVFAVAAVTVEGTELLTTDEVAAAAAVPLGLPMVRLDTAAVVERVRQLPAVAAAEAVRHLGGTVEIRVVERQPVYGQLDGAAVRLVDATGCAYAEVAAVPDGLLTASLADSSDRLRAAVAVVVTALPETLRSSVTALNAASVDHIELSLASGATVLWGSADDSSFKGQVAAALVAGVAASYYDVSAPNSPATR